MRAPALTRSGDFRRVYGEGKRARRNGVGIVVLKRPDDAPARVGYTVRKAAGSAVTRNRIKRRLRAAAATVEFVPGVDVVLSGDPEVGVADFQILVDHVQGGLRSLGATR